MYVHPLILYPNKNNELKLTHIIVQMETSAKLYSLPFGNVRTYLFALLFVVGNIALPQLCHLVPAGGPTLLPIYFSH